MHREKTQGHPAVGTVHPVDEAYARWQRCCTDSGWRSRVTTEIVTVSSAVGRITARPVYAEWSSPAEQRTAMDGIAVLASHTSQATEQHPLRLTTSMFDVVDTGDPLPAGRDTVIMREHVRRAPDGTMEIVAAVLTGRHVRGVGEDVTRGELLLPAGHRIRPVDAAVAAGGGHCELLVASRPVAVVIPTGDEVKPIGSSLGPGDVLDTNSLMLTEFARGLGCTAHTTPIAPDHPSAIASEITAAGEIADLVLVIAGSSAGRDDHTASVLATLGKVAVHGVAMRPGHPVALGVVDLAHPVPVIGVPGYPVAAAQVFRSFATPMIAQLQGRRNVSPDTVQATVVRDVASPPRVHDHILVELRPEAGTLTAIPVGRGAGALSSLMRADGILCVPFGVDGLTTGQNATVELLEH